MKKLCKNGRRKFCSSPIFRCRQLFMQPSSTAQRANYCIVISAPVFLECHSPPAPWQKKEWHSLPYCSFKKRVHFFSTLFFQKFQLKKLVKSLQTCHKFQILCHKKSPPQDFIKRTLAIGMWTRILFRLLAHLSNVYFPVTIFGHLSAYLHLSSLSTAGISWLLLLLL